MKKLILFLIGVGLTTHAFGDAAIYSTIQNGRQTVTTAGTRVQLSSTDTPCTKVVITAETDNTGVITVGGSGVVGALATRQGTPLSAGASVTVLVNNLNKIYL